MGFSNDIYKKALSVKINYANREKQLCEYKKKSAYDNIPRLSEIDFELSSIGSKAAISALNGKAGILEDLKIRCDELTKEKQKLLSDADVKPYVPSCPLCSDTGYCKNELCKCVKSIAKDLLTDELSGSMPIKDSTFESFSLSFYSSEKDSDGNVPKSRMKSILNFCKDYAANFNASSESLLFLGGAGLGKTHLSLAIGRTVLDKGFGVIYGTSQNLLSQLEKEYFSREGGEYMDTVLSCDLLIIDDLGTEFSTQFTHSCLYNIINTRVLKNLPTVINTNLSFSEIEERYTARITSRLAGNYTIKKFLGRDIRIMKKTSAISE